MTTAKRLLLAAMALLAFGATTAYHVTAMAMRGKYVLSASFHYAALALAAALTALVLVSFWRNLHRGVASMAAQLRTMTRRGQIGLVMPDGSDGLSLVSKPLNELLIDMRRRMGRLEDAKRELEIELRIAQAEKQHTEAIIHSISDSVLVTNRFDELVLANEAAQKALDFSLPEMPRRDIEQATSKPAIARLVREARYRRTARKSAELTFGEGEMSRTYSVSVNCLTTNTGDVSGVVTVLHDVTREKEIGQIKTDFVSHVSHELKTPLSAMKAYLEMLIDGDVADDAARQECYQIIAEQTQRLHRLIENILNISRIESGAVRPNLELVDPTRVIRQVLDVAAAQAKAGKLRLSDRLESCGRCVLADNDMLYQAVMNLVSNAIKYTPAGGAVSVSCWSDPHRCVLVGEVTDNGLGISEQDLPHVFDKFFRVREASRSAKGTGLGLTLAKHVFETFHSGKLSASSETGKGSTFRFELPMAQSGLKAAS